MEIKNRNNTKYVKFYSALERYRSHSKMGKQSSRAGEEARLGGVQAEGSSLLVKLCSLIWNVTFMVLDTHVSQLRLAALAASRLLVACSHE